MFMIGSIAGPAALSSFIRTLSGELIGRGIRVNAVSPGPIATPLHGKIGMDDEAVKGLVAQIPAKRRGEPAEIAKASCSSPRTKRPSRSAASSPSMAA